MIVNASCPAGQHVHRASLSYARSMRAVNVCLRLIRKAEGCADNVTVPLKLSFQSRCDTRSVDSSVSFRALDP